MPHAPARSVCHPRPTSLHSSRIAEPAIHGQPLQCWLITQILNPILRWLKIPRRKLCAGYRRDRTPDRRRQRTSCRRPGRCVLPVALIPALYRAPPLTSRLRFHGLTRPSAAIKASQSARISPSISAGSETVRATSSRTTAKYRLRSR
jgi:hypothetical protein